MPRSPDEQFMGRALELARRGWGQTAPNPMVGAVIVREGEIIGEGFHARFGEEHAEVVALRAAGTAASGATMYVTLEPCAHRGKTPPCVDAIAAAGIRRVVASSLDPNPAAQGGVSRLRADGIEVIVGVGEDEARELNAPFFNAFVSDRPWTTLKLAISIDGALADYSRATGWMTSDLSRQAVHQLRAGHDAVAVGMGTVLADDPQLTVRDVPAPRVPPVRVVFSRTGRLPLTSRLAQSVHEVPVIVFAEMPDPSYEHLLQQLGVEVLSAPTLEDALRALAGRGLRSVIVEGGARLAASLLTDRLVDRLVIFQAPVILGAGSVNAFGDLPGARVADAHRLRVIRHEASGGDLVTVFAPEAR